MSAFPQAIFFSFKPSESDFFDTRHIILSHVQSPPDFPYVTTAKFHMSLQYLRICTSRYVVNV